MLVPQPSILFIDAYDSFTNNIISLLTTTLSCSVRVIHIDSPYFATDELLHDELRHYDAVVCGPGPGDPANEKDVGLMNRIWRLDDKNIIPVLGICLGFQNLALAFGGKIKILPEGLHGIIKRVRYTGEDGLGPKSEVFSGVGEIYATLYHSLYIDIGQDALSTSEWKNRMWDEFPGCADLQPLAWVSPVDEHDLEQTGTKNGPILTAVQHKTKPFYGLQYHPESICTNKESRKVIMNWFVAAQRWNRENNRNPRRDQSNVRGELSIRRSLLNEVEEHRNEGRHASTESKRFLDTAIGSLAPTQGPYESRIIELPDGATIPELVWRTRSSNKDHIVLESSNSHIQGPGAADVRGRYSIIGLEIESALQIEYQVKNDWALVRPAQYDKNLGAQKVKIPLAPFGGIWQFLAAFLEKRQIEAAQKDVPFLGGFIGYTTYELGLEGINVEHNIKTRGEKSVRPDLCFAWVTRSLVIDHLEKKIHIQQLVDKNTKGQQRWLEEFATFFNHASWGSSSRLTDPSSSNSTPYGTCVIMPSSRIYESKVRACQESIRKGNSYELCLTDQTHVSIAITSPNSTSFPQQADPAFHSSWNLYRTLRSRQPAPFSSFIRLGNATFVSCSPERFLKWDNSTGKCSLRPMKGTVKKTSAITTLAQATALLNVPKERAENLMIVDLVRHDLHGVCGPGNVSVPRLMVVEEYASVFQMISVVEGQIPLPDDISSRKTRYTGIDVLAASLPPGSMTGAPKKRSCELLQEIEGHDNERSLYSGVVGYMDVGGRGDFSVNIRCMFRWDDEVTNPREDDEQHETWHIGAGGAVTALSTPVAEREEMQTKLAGTLGIFGLEVEK